MKAIEFGLLEHNKRSPVHASFFSSATYFAGSLSSILPFGFTSDSSIAFIAATILTILCLCAVGYLTSPARNREKILDSILFNVTVAGFGGAISFGAGELIHSIL